MPFGSLWLPVLVSAVVVFVISSVLHMVLKYHRADYRQLPQEAALRAVFAKDNPGPGYYIVPFCEMKDMNTPEVRAKYEQGPVGVLTLMRNGAPPMTKLLVQWFVFAFVVSFLVGYIARHTLTVQTPGLEIMRITGAAAFGFYGLSHVSDSIWKGQPWGNTVRMLLDGLIYGLATGLCFRLLWPAA